MANKIEVQASLRDDLTARLEKVSQSINKASRDVLTMGPILNQAAGFAANFALEMLNVAKQAALLPIKYSEMAESLGKLKTATGLSYRELQALRQALEEAGSAPESLNAAMRILNVNLATGDKTLAKYHITARTSYAALLQVGQALAATGDSTRKSELAMAAFGRSSQDLIDTISKFATDPTYRQAMESIGISDEGIAKLQQVDEKVDRLKRSWKGLMNEIAVGMSGPAGGVMDWLAKAVSYVTSAENLPGMKRLYDVEREAMRSRKGMYPSGLSWSAGATDHAVSTFSPTAPTSPSGGSSAAADMIRQRNYLIYGPPNRPEGWGLGRGLMVGADRFSPTVPQVPNAWDRQGGMAESLQKNVAMVRQMSQGVSAGFETMFNSIFIIQRRSKNIVVALFQDLFNGIVSGLTQRAGSAIGGWFLDLATSFIPGGGAVKGALGGGGGANTVINYTSLTAPNLVQSAVSPSGELRQANVILRQMAAVR